MSNLSDIGFPVQNEQDVNVLITETIQYVESLKCPQGFYLRFADESGAEIKTFTSCSFWTGKPISDKLLIYFRKF